MINWDDVSNEQLFAELKRRLAPPAIRHSPNDNKKVVVAVTNKYGLVLIARETISTGEHIASFDGRVEIVRKSSCADLPNDPPEYFGRHAIQIGPNVWQDSNGVARYASHSCDPNCGIKNFRDITAMRDIQPGEEITWDYAMTENPEADDLAMTCLCHAPNCRKVIRGYRHLPENFRQRYEGFLSGWLIGETGWLAPRNSN